MTGSEKEMLKLVLLNRTNLCLLGNQTQATLPTAPGVTGCIILICSVAISN